jgi:Tfp pilus assembly protein PilP
MIMTTPMRAPAPVADGLMVALVAALLIGLGLVAACGDSKPPPPAEKKAGEQQPPPPGAPPPGAPPPGAPPAPGMGPTTADNKPPVELAEKDFVEGPANRDPFRSFLAEFNRPRRVAKKTERKIISPRYALDELKLIAVVTGGTRPLAMFRDPTGLGVTVKRGDYISKNAGKVKHILTDKVVVEIEEQSEDKSSLVDRVIDLHPKESDATTTEEGQ